MAEKQANFRHIVRVANVDLPGEKQTRFALTKIKGIGINFADSICAVTGVDKNVKVGMLGDEDVKKLNDIIQTPKENGVPVWMFNRRKDYTTGEDQHLITGSLGFVKENDLKRLKKIKTLRGMRHQKGLPVRGQRNIENSQKTQR